MKCLGSKTLETERLFLRSSKMAEQSCIISVTGVTVNTIRSGSLDILKSMEKSILKSKAEIYLHIKIKR